MGVFFLTESLVFSWDGLVWDFLLFVLYKSKPKSNLSVLWAVWYSLCKFSIIISAVCFVAPWENCFVAPWEIRTLFVAPCLLHLGRIVCCTLVEFFCCTLGDSHLVCCTLFCCTLGELFVAPWEIRTLFVAPCFVAPWENCLLPLGKFILANVAPSTSLTWTLVRVRCWFELVRVRVQLPRTSKLTNPSSFYITLIVHF